MLFIGGPYMGMMYGAIGFLGFLGTFMVLAIVRGQALTVQHVCDYLREIESMRVEER